MNLPILSGLHEDQSTYISFSKALLDFDKASSNNEVCYFTKMVALRLPNWENPEFFIDLADVSPAPDPALTPPITDTNPNYVFPRTLQYYMENIIRQDISDDGENVVEEVTELAFWKTLNKLGLVSDDVKATFTFNNEILISNFISTENNNGWAEIVAQIPNKSQVMIPAWRTVTNVADVVQGSDDDSALWDNGLKQFLFDDDFKKVIDFNNITYDAVTESTFDFNVLLIFYTDASGIEKLHGINFIYPFENKVTYWDLETFTQKTNVAQTLGYQFKFNLKSCNNNATQVLVYELQEHTALQQFSETLGKLNAFLEIKIREDGAIV